MSDWNTNLDKIIKKDADWRQRIGQTTLLADGFSVKDVAARQGCKLFQLSESSNTDF